MEPARTPGHFQTLILGWEGTALPVPQLGKLRPRGWGAPKDPELQGEAGNGYGLCLLKPPPPAEAGESGVCPRTGSQRPLAQALPPGGLSCGGGVGCLELVARTG